MKHKAKKGVLTKIGMHEEKQEDPIFQAVLFSVTQFKNELKDISFKAHGLANAGTGYNHALEFLCGAGLKGEILFDREQKFIDCIKEGLCQVLSKIIETDIPEMDELVVAYKGTKLDYDRVYYQTVKDMTKKEIAGTDSRDEVLKNNANLPNLLETWEKSKKAVIDQRNVYKGRLDNEVLKALQEVTDVSDAPHHRLYIDYFKERILITSAMCQSGTVSARKTAIPITASELIEANEESDEVENEKECETSPVQVEQEEKKVEPPKSIDEEKARGSTQEEKQGPAVESSIREVPALPSENVEDAKAVDDDAVVMEEEVVAAAPPVRAPTPPCEQEISEEDLLPPPARMPPQPPVEPVEPPQEPVVEVQPPQVAEVPPQAPVGPPQAPVGPPQAPAVPAEVLEGPPQPPAVPDQEPVVPPQAPPVVVMEPEMPPQPPVVPDQEPGLPPQAPVDVAMDPEMSPEIPAVPQHAPLGVPQPPAVLPQPPAGPPQPPAVQQQPPVGPPAVPEQPPVGPPAVPQQPPAGPQEPVN